MSPDSGLSCPGCGAPLEVRNPGVLQITCPYCGNVSYWNEQGIRDAGRRSVLPEGFTRLYRGATGTLNHHRFEVLGRVRYSFGHGFWDEWYLQFDDGSTPWLTEDNHELAIEQPTPPIDVPSFQEFRPGRTFYAGDTPFVVQEVGHAECLGVEGQLPRNVLPGERYPYVDASSPDGRYTLAIEYDDDPPTLFRGHWLKWSALRLDDEGDAW